MAIWIRRGGEPDTAAAADRQVYERHGFACVYVGAFMRGMPADGVTETFTSMKK